MHRPQQDRITVKMPSPEFPLIKETANSSENEGMRMQYLKLWWMWCHSFSWSISKMKQWSFHTFYKHLYPKIGIQQVTFLYKPNELTIELLSHKWWSDHHCISPQYCFFTYVFHSYLSCWVPLEYCRTRIPLRSECSLEYSEKWREFYSLHKKAIDVITGTDSRRRMIQKLRHSCFHHFFCDA